MKTDLDHLPERKREQVTAIAAVVRANAPVDMVILFGSYARGDWVEDLGTGYFSDYDLMAIVETKAVLGNRKDAPIRRVALRLRRCILFS